MAEDTTPNTGSEWTDDEVQRLRDLNDSNTPAGLIANELGRTDNAVRSKAQAEGISLSPPNRSPYGDMS